MSLLMLFRMTLFSRSNATYWVLFFVVKRFEFSTAPINFNIFNDFLDDGFFDYFLNLFDNVNRNFNNLFDSGISSVLIGFFYFGIRPNLLWKVAANIASYYWSTHRSQFVIQIKLITFLLVLFFLNFHGIIDIIGCNAVLFLTAAEQRHQSSIDLLFFLIDVNWHWNFYNQIFLDIYWNLLDWLR